jgi:hypothetical protein
MELKFRTRAAPIRYSTTAAPRANANRKIVQNANMRT